jgi:hypothetical protein
VSSICAGPPFPWLGDDVGALRARLGEFGRVTFLGPLAVRAHLVDVRFYDILTGKRSAGIPPNPVVRLCSRVPSAKPCLMNCTGMNNPKTRQQLRTGDIDAWGIKKKLSVAAALGAKRARLVIEW